MSSKPVYVVRHYCYEYYEFEKLIGLAATKEVAEHMARNNEHVYVDEPVITYSWDEHLELYKKKEAHVYIELIGVAHEV